MRVDRSKSAGTHDSRCFDLPRRTKRRLLASKVHDAMRAVMAGTPGGVGKVEVLFRAVGVAKALSAIGGGGLKVRTPETLESGERCESSTSSADAGKVLTR